MKNNAVEYVRNNPQIFFHGGQYSHYEILTKVVIDAVSLGCTSLVIEKKFDFWIIASDENWININNPHGLEKVFSRLTPNPNAGQNVSRSEILLNAFIDNVVFMSKSQIFFSKGNIQHDLLINIKSNIAQNYILVFS